MKGRFAFFVLLLALIAAPTIAGAQYFCQSTSVAEAKKRDIFIRPISVDPDHFSWEGHDVVVSECWLERYGQATDFGKSDSDCILIKFVIDRNPRNEQRIRKREHKGIDLSWDDADVPSHYQPREFHFCSSRKMLSLTPGCDLLLHYLLVSKKSEPKTVRLTIETRQHGMPRWVAPVTTNSSATTLTLRLEPDGSSVQKP
jgi:hypothetical protein